MLKIISIILGTTIYTGHQIKPAIAEPFGYYPAKMGLVSQLGVSPSGQSHRVIAFADNAPHVEHPLILGNNRLLNHDASSDQENLTKILILAGLASAIGIIGWQLSRQGRSATSMPRLGKANNKPLIDRVSPKLRRQLLRLINDPKTANRLLMGIHQHHRDRNPDWLAEKVIYDLRRGR